jgi:hypothetical protein
MTKQAVERLFLNVAMIAAVPLGIWVGYIAIGYVSAQQNVPPEAAQPNPPMADPITVIGHGAILGRDGKPFELTAQTIERVQEYYIQDLLAADLRRDKEKRLPEADLAAARKAIGEATDDKLLANALLLDWLVEKIKPANQAHVVAANTALRWHYVSKLQENPVLPDKGTWGKGLKPEAAKKLGEKLGTVVFMVTTQSGEEYCNECVANGVPVPEFMFGREWRFVGEITNEFLSESDRAELWIHESSDPPGVCLALPRFQSDNRATLFGVICLGRDTSKVCFFDNPREIRYRRDERVEFRKSFLGGTSLVTNPGGGVCTDCHAGENPYVVHPDQPTFLSIGSSIQSLAWYDPLVDVSWPQNPGPTNLLDAVNPVPPSTQRCDSCHRAGLAGRFPVITSQLNQYCNFILATATGPSTKRTMPQGGGPISPNFDTQLMALKGSCGSPPDGGGVVVDVDLPRDDPSVLSPPLIIEPLYGCATSVSVRGAVLDAKVSLFVNEALVGTPIFPARNTHKLEFTGLPALNAEDKVVAVQEKDGATAKSPEALVRDHRVDYPMGLPAPVIDPTLVFECASVISIRHVPGAKVTIFSNGGMPVDVSGSTDWTVFSPAKRPFVKDDKFTAVQSLCGDPPSPMSAEVTAVAAPASLAPVKFNPPQTYPGQELVTLEALTNGATTEVSVAGHGSVGKFDTPVSWFPDFDVATPLGRKLNSGDQLTALHTLCQMRVATDVPKTGPCEDLPAPRILHPIVGTQFVVVSSSVPGARIRVYDDANKEIGDGSGTVIWLTRKLTGTDVLTVVQQVGACTSKTGYRVSVRNPMD